MASTWEVERIPGFTFFIRVVRLILGVRLMAYSEIG